MNKICRNLIKIRSCDLSDLTGLAGFLVTLRSINVFIFDWLIRKYETFLLVNSWCLRNKLKLAWTYNHRAVTWLCKFFFLLLWLCWFWFNKKILARKSCILVWGEAQTFFFQKRKTIFTYLHRPYTDLPTSAFTTLSMYYMCTNDLVFSSTDSFSPNANSYSLGSLLTNRNLPHSQKTSRNDFHGPLGQALPLPSRAPFFVG